MHASFHLGPDGTYRCQAFQEFSWQSHAFGTRRANPAALTLRQIHSNLVWNASGLQDREREGDALISNQPGQTIGIRTADCVPILLLDTTRRAVGAVHAGWRGTSAGIVRRAIQNMTSSFASQVPHLLAAIGPCIRECCYEVGSEVAAHFAGTFPEWAALAPTPQDKRNLSLPEANIRQLLDAGLSRAQIFDCGLCTACRLDTFYSYRREPREPGRLISAITRLS